MKKRLLLLLLCITFGLNAYNISDYNRLLSGDKDLKSSDLSNVNLKNKDFEDVDFSNANLTGSYFEECSFYNSNLKNSNFYDSKLINCDFRVKNIDQISNAKRMVLVRPTFSVENETALRKLGAFIPNKSIICNSDLHINADNSQEKYKKKHIPRMINATKDSRNRVKAIVIAGDMCDWGDKKDWDEFVDTYYDPLKNTGKDLLMTAGNHDRWQREDTLSEKLNMWLRTAMGLGSVPIEKIKDLYGGKIYYKKYVSSGMDIISLGECPTMTNKYNKGAISWYKNLSHKYPEIIFYHYSPLKMTDWWTTGDDPRPTSSSRGKASLESFNESLRNYKDRIAMMITGHHHSTFFDYWKGVPVVNVGGKDRFAICHFYINRDKRINEPMIVELVHHDSSNPSKFYYPCLDDLDTREDRTKLLTHYYRTYLYRDPDPRGLSNYLNYWYKRGEEEGIVNRIKNSNEGRSITLRNIYLTHLKREPDESGFNYYLSIWDKVGGFEEVEKEVSNSREARTLILFKLYLECLEKKPTEKWLNSFLDNWDEKGGASGIEKYLKNSNEGRSITLRNIYLKHLDREPDEDGFNYYLSIWDKVGGFEKIEKEISNSKESKTVILFNLYLECLEKKPTEKWLNSFLDNWDEKGEASGIEKYLKNSNEGRSITLRNIYLKHLDREPDEDGFNYYLSIWDKVGGFEEIEKEISNSKEAKQVIISNLFNKYLNRDATNDEYDHYLNVWSRIDGKDGLERELLTYYS